MGSRIERGLWKRESLTVTVRRMNFHVLLRLRERLEAEPPVDPVCVARHEGEAISALDDLLPNAEHQCGGRKEGVDGVDIEARAVGGDEVIGATEF
jgi:hypothetical protein